VPQALVQPVVATLAALGVALKAAGAPPAEAVLLHERRLAEVACVGLTRLTTPPRPLYFARTACLLCGRRCLLTYYSRTKVDAALLAALAASGLPHDVAEASGAAPDDAEGEGGEGGKKPAQLWVVRLTLGA